MTHRASISNQLFDLPSRWKATLSHYSVDTLQFLIEYHNSALTCPICGVKADVIRSRDISWKPRDFLGYQVIMTAQLPVIDSHNGQCRVDWEQSVLANTLFLDLIVSQVKFTDIYNPFQYLLQLSKPRPKLSLPRLDDEAWRLSPYLTVTAAREHHAD